jgi:hypothetical protein
MSTNASNNQHVDNTPSDLLEMPPTVEDAKHVTSHHRFLITQEPDASKDKRPDVVAFREDPQMDIPASNAQLVRSETQELSTRIHALMHHHALVNMLFNYQSILKLVVDARIANGQDKFQTYPELHVLTDHSLTAQTADRDNLLINIHAKHAQLDKLYH